MTKEMHSQEIIIQMTGKDTYTHNPDNGAVPALMHS